MEERNARARGPDAAPALRAVGLCRHFPAALGLRRRRALEGIDLDLAPGAFLGLLGPNGSGKSTLLRLAAGVDRPSAGRVEAFGIDLAGRASRVARARLAYLPDDSPFPDELSARAALDLIGALAGLERRERRARVEPMLERVELGPVAGRALRTYSRGMLRRFGLAQAFLAAPDLVLLDEPTAGLDAPGYRVLDELTGEARARGCALVVASHLLSDLHATCDRLAVLLDGRLAACGTPAEVLSPEEQGAARVVRGLDDRGRAALEDWAREHGAEIALDDGGRPTLAALFARLSSTEPRA